MTTVPETITCVDCGETAHLLSVRGDAGGESQGLRGPGHEVVAAYRCAGCWDRWDVVVGPDEPGSDAPEDG